MPASPITHLRHVAMAVPDFSAATAFYEGVWGLTRVADDSGIAFYAAVGSPEHYVLRVREAAEKRLDLMAFGASDAATVDRLAADLTSHRADTPSAARSTRVKERQRICMMPYRERGRGE